MAEPLVIPLSNLLIDVENPRLSTPNVGQREALRELAQDQQGKLVKLAQHIVNNGPNQSDLPIVMPFDDRRYVVLEGNRRLAALRGLENPDSMVGALTQPLVTTLRRLSADYQQNPVESLNCLVVRDREEARPWIELRHTGENEGAGIVGWNANQTGRFRARTRTLEPHLQALDFLEAQGVLTPENRRKVPTASFKRLMSSPVLRGKVGVDVKDKQLQILGNERKVAKALLHVVNDLASGKVKTEHIYTKDDREKYANSLPSSVVVTPAAKGGRPAATKGTTPATPPRAPAVRLPRQRDKLIPRDCAMNIADPRIRRIEAELRNLSLEDYTNAVSVLFRVFIELSADAYIARIPLSTGVMANLATKIQDVANDLVARGQLTHEQARPVRRAAVRDSFLAPSITLLHGYVHNPHIFPAPGDLRAHWDSLQPFFIAIWTP
jgi:hypothetical protein